MSLDRSEFLGQDIGVSYGDLDSGLSVKLVNEKRLLLFVVVVKTWLDRREDIIRLERDHIVQEASELVNL